MLQVAIPYIFNDEDWLGGRNYFANLIRAIRLVASDQIDLTLVTGRKTQTTLPDEFPDLNVLRTSLLDRKSLGWFLRTFDLHVFDNDRLFACYLRRKGFDVLTHCMHLGPSPGIVTLAWLYDFQFLYLPELWTKKQFNWSTQWYKAACRYCDALLVSSASALADLNKFSPSGTSLREVLHFVSNPIPPCDILSIDQLKETYGIADRYIFLPNQFWKNKNHELVVQALRILKSSGHQQIQIVCTGNTVDHRQPVYFAQLMQKVSQCQLEDNFLVLGILPLHHAQSLMYHSLAVLNPSFFEGWSTSVEEAKTMDKLILLSSISVHIEQNPPRALFFDPRNASQLSDCILSVFTGSASALRPTYQIKSYEERLKDYGYTYLLILEKALRDSRKRQYLI